MDRTKQSELVEMVAKYVEAAIPLASANVQAGELISLAGGDRWKSTGPGQFQREDSLNISWVVAINNRATQLHALPEYKLVVAFIEANEGWRRQFGNLVGTQWSQMRLDLDWFLDGCLGAALSASSENRDPATATAETAEAMVRFLDSTEIPLEIVGPLFGLNAAGIGHIHLAPNVAIVPIDETEVERLYSIGLLHPMTPHLPFITAPSHFARVIRPIPKVVGGMDAALDPQLYLDHVKVAEDAIENVLVCLRLLKAGQIGLGGRATLIPSYIGRSWQTSPARSALSPHIHASYLLQDHEAGELKELWGQLHSSGTVKTKQLTLAARRFAYKGDRSRVDDQLVDLMVAAEALFLSDTDEEIRGELRFRLSSRAASYIHDPTRSRKSIYRLFMAAYRMRSRLVHGSEAKQSVVDGEEFPPARMVETIEALLRLALKQALSEASKATRWTVDWESLMFPGPGSASPGV